MILGTVLLIFINNILLEKMYSWNSKRFQIMQKYVIKLFNISLTKSRNQFIDYI